MHQTRQPIDGEAWAQLLRDVGAIWWHDGSAERPHAILTSGLHSNGFMNGDCFKQFPHMMDWAAHDLVSRLEERGLKLKEVDCVIGPAMGAITLAHDVARVIARETGQAVRATYAEKGESGEDRFVFKRTHVLPGERVLIVEDVITTGGSSLAVADAVRRSDGVVLPFIGALVIRHENAKIDGLSIAHLTGFFPHAWEKEECPLCRKGSKAIRPKGRAGWNALTCAP